MAGLDRDRDRSVDKSHDVRNVRDEESNAMQRLIREEVRALVREEMAAGSSGSGPASASASEPAPPAYDASARLPPADAGKADDPGTVGAPARATDVEAARLLSSSDLDDPDDPQDRDGSSPPHWVQRLPWPLRVLILLVPIPLSIIAPIVAAPDLEGFSELRISLQAFLAWLIVIFTCLITLAFSRVVLGLGGPRKKNKTSAQPSPSDPPALRKTVEEKQTKFAVNFFYIYAFCLTFLSIALFLWSMQTSGSVYPRFQLAGRFDAKVTQADALSRLTSCLYETSPATRNATLDDFVACLSAMGLKSNATVA